MIKTTLQLLLVFQLAFVSKTFSQNIAINTTGNMPDTSAMLDITSTNKGLLIPRMTTADMNAIALPANGLLIYNTSVNLFEVNNGTPSVPNWVPIGTSQTGWNLTGNSGTNSGTNFLGTTDNMDLVFKVNNSIRAIAPKNNNIGLLSGDPASMSSYLTAPLNLYGGGFTTFNHTHSIYSFSASGSSYGWDGAAASGTPGAPGIPVANALMSTTNGLLYDGTSFVKVARMRMHADGTPTSTSLPTKITFWTTPTGSKTDVERLTIKNDGKVGIGIATPAQKLHIAGQVQIDTLTSGALTDSIVTVNANGTPGGVLRKLTVASVIKNMWTITGNTATTSGTNTIGNAADGNYAGTTDTSRFVIGINGTKRMIFDQFGNAYGGDGGTSVQTTAGVITSNNSRNFVWGNNNQITTNSANGGARSNAMFGGGNKIIGDYYGSNLGAQNFVTGSNNTVIGSGNFVAGLNNNDTASYSFVAGGNNTMGSSASYGVAIGRYLTVSTANQTAVGTYNKDTLTAAFAVGTGTGTGAASSNAITVSNGGSIAAYKGNIGINNVNDPLKRLHINAANSSGAADSLKIDNLALSAGSSKKQYVVIDSATGYVSRSNMLPGMIQAITVTSATGASAYTVKTTDYIVEFTGTSAAAWTLPSSPVTGQIYQLVNMGTADVTLSGSVTLGNGITSTVLGTGTGNIQNTGATATVNILGNKSTIAYDGTKWIQVNN